MAYFWWWRDAGEVERGRLEIGCAA